MGEISPSFLLLPSPEPFQEVSCSECLNRIHAIRSDDGTGCAEENGGVQNGYPDTGVCQALLLLPGYAGAASAATEIIGLVGDFKR
jgi:hypothetical protein